MNFTLEQTPEQFAAALIERGRRRAAFLWDTETGQLWCSDDALLGLGEAIQSNTRDFDEHEAVLLEVGRESGALLGAFLHKTARGQGAGGVRRWRYSNLEAVFNDGLRLARGMGRKNALAGLWWGGGKGIICQPEAKRDDDFGYRELVYTDYGRFITSLRGAYITAEDVGTTAADMANIYRATRFVTCVPAEVGGSGNPSSATARGVVCAMEAALEFSGGGSLAGKRIAVQGVGNVGGFILGILLEKGVAQIVGNDINERLVQTVQRQHDSDRLKLSVVTPDDTSIFEVPCDIFAPNALGGVLRPDTIRQLDTKLVCGAANNQLLDPTRDARLLRQREILHVPDYLANRMGIVQCANEQYGSLPDDPSILKHFDPRFDGSIQQVTQQVLSRAQAESIPPTQAADEIADERSRIDHPLWPHRTRDILLSLRNNGWHRG